MRTLRVRVRDGKPELLWKGPLHNWYHSAVVDDGHVYMPHGDDRISCLDLDNGEPKYGLGRTDKLPKPKTWSSGRGGVHGGGFTIADGKALLIDAKGSLVIYDVSAAIPRLLSRIKVLDPDRSPYKYETAPVLANGRVYCRNTDGQIVCLDVRK
ncbi:hypothetical protein LCGC14_2616220 [marine sediment metagenome]|uniref:Uncharacterized protein n=1 Tax=marine sediment metagenome TaxID=412755 RepID=A0A0F9AS05_9ZZZZ